MRRLNLLDFVAGTSRRACFLTLISFLCTFAATTGVHADQKQIADFFAAQGCAIGPSTIAAARAKGFDALAVDAYVATARAIPKTTKTGEWLVLPPDVCEIKLPNVTSAIRMTDAEVTQSLTAIDAYAKDGDVGCFLLIDNLINAVILNRGWDEEKAFLEYIRFLGASIISGEASFYSPDPLRTPPSLVVTTGKCADIPQLANIKRSHALMIKHFDAAIRADAAGEAVCDAGHGPSWQFSDIMEKIAGERPPNAFLSFEVSVIVRAAGWYDGMTARQKGEPRPPLCRYP